MTNREVDESGRNRISKLMDDAPPSSVEEWGRWSDNKTGEKTVWYSAEVPLKFDLNLSETDKSKGWYTLCKKIPVNNFVLYKAYSEYSDAIVNKIVGNIHELENIIV
jgi:hypothetical protein